MVETGKRETTFKEGGTYEDLLALPEHVTGQILDGLLVAEPRPAYGHQVAATALDRILAPVFHLGGTVGGWRLTCEVEVHLKRNVLVPDLAGWRVDRHPAPAALSDPFVAVAPDWVCEVLSPSTGALDRTRKMRIYAREGVDHVWLVNPVDRTLEVYRREGSRWLLLDSFAGEERVRAEPFETLELDLGALWRG